MQFSWISEKRQNGCLAFAPFEVVHEGSEEIALHINAVSLVWITCSSALRPAARSHGTDHGDEPGDVRGGCLKRSNISCSYLFSF